MLSRVADSLFWLGRYLDRAENYSRFIEVNFNLSLELPTGMKTQWEPLITATGDCDLYNSIYEDFNRSNAIKFLAFDSENPNSIISSITHARENARVVRENIAKETWEILNDLYHYVNNAHENQIWLNEDHPEVFLKSVKEKTQALHGQVVNTGLRTIGWYFLNLGHFIERADKTSRILDLKYHMLLPTAEEVGSPLDFLHWAALLKSVSGYNAYRRLHGAIDPHKVVHFLTLEKLFPRSILYCVEKAESCLRKIGSLRSELEFNDVEDIIKYGLHEFLDGTQKKLNKISDGIYQKYFRIRDNFVTQTQTQS